ncbi:MAG TPA: phosphoribosyltransferase family protein [Pyrinomonadaceae bacterium]|nr:phosphoribosyltransferase family protein [Pyrinomonadaceae bacterium]
MSDNIKPFLNLSSAGKELATKLLANGAKGDIIVLGIVTAGVPVAVEVARTLKAPLDLVLIRRLLAPGGPGTQACAVNVAGHLVVDEHIPPRPEKPETPFDSFMEDALNAITLRAEVCRGNRPPFELEGRSILLVDCGIRTSLTMQAAIGAIRTLYPKSITAATPVTSSEGCTVVEALADQFIYLAAPEPFGNAGMWYRDFSRPGDEAIGQLLASFAGQIQGASGSA